MSSQESRYLVSLLAFLAVSAEYARRVAALHAAGAFEGEEGLAFAGRAVLWFIAAMVAAGILAQILHAVLRGLFGAETDMREDERDRQVEFRAMRAAFTVLSLFFLAAMGALGFLGWSAFAVLQTILAGFVAAGIVADLWRIALYRWGFRL